MLFSAAEHPPVRVFVLQTAPVTLPLLWTDQSHFLRQFQVLEDVKTHQPQLLPSVKEPCTCVSPPRAYVEFWRSSQDTGVLPEVSLSLLLAQQSPSPPMDLSVHPTEKIESSTGLRNISQLKYARCSSLCVLICENVQLIYSRVLYLTIYFLRTRWWNQKYSTAVTLTVVKKKLKKPICDLAFLHPALIEWLQTWAFSIELQLHLCFNWAEWT